MEQPLASDDLYKHTIVADYVVKRHVKLFKDRFETYADVNAPRDHRTYKLDGAAKLVPASKEQIKKKKRHLRPPGVGSMTALAALRGKGAQLELWTFQLEWDDGSSFTFCFREQDQAYHWHDLLSKIVSDYGAIGAIGADASAFSQAASARTSYTDDRDPSNNTFTGMSSGGFLPASRMSSPEGGSALGEGGRLTPAAQSTQGARDQDDDDDDDIGSLLNVPTGSTSVFKQSWVPYRHSNGLAIYQHSSSANGASPEYMVSATIRGRPKDVLAALLDPTSATTVLGPALEVEVMDSSPGKQLLRIQLQAEGPTAAWFSPREAVVQRRVARREEGVYVVLFSSVDTHLAPTVSQQEGVIEIAEGMGDHVRYSRPVRCRVQGGYTISKMVGYSASDSPETLLTCILQVEDMGGWLCPGHRLFKFVNWVSGGAYEAFLERMLLGVMLVRDLVEKSKFTVTPQVFEARGFTAALPSAATEAAYFSKLPAQRSSTFVMRQMASTFSTTRPAGAAGLAPAAAAAAAGVGPSPLGGISPFQAAGGAGLLSPLSSFAAGGPGGLQHPGLALKISRLASQRLPAGPSVATRSLSDQLGHVQEEVQQDKWDASFKLPHKYYDELHTPGHEAPFKVRGPSYLTDGVKMPPGAPMFELLGMELVDTGGAGPLPHVSRFLPSVRRNPKPFLFVWSLMMPGPPTMCVVFVFGTDCHPDSLGAPPDDPEDCDWQPFDFLMWRFLHGNDEERRSLFKMIPRIADGSWVIKQSVGTTPVVLGRKLATDFFITPKYVEVSVDVGSTGTAAYITGMVRGATKNLVVDLGIVLEGQHTWELPEVLLGAVRIKKLDLAAASKLDDSQEVPMLHVTSPEVSGASATPSAATAESSTAESAAAH